MKNRSRTEIVAMILDSTYGGAPEQRLCIKPFLVTNS